MKKGLFKAAFLIIFFFLILIIFFNKFTKKDDISKETNLIEEDLTYKANILKDVNYVSKDTRGNEYIIKASKGEIDFSNNNVIYLTDVVALIKLNNSRNIEIYSNFGKYNTINNDTIFSKNVIVNYLENKITGEYLDFSLQRNSMIISRDVNYINSKNVLKADVVEINIKTKDAKIFMYEKDQKVQINNIN